MSVRVARFEVIWWEAPVSKTQSTVNGLQYLPHSFYLFLILPSLKNGKKLVYLWGGEPSESCFTTLPAITFPPIFLPKLKLTFFDGMVGTPSMKSRTSNPEAICSGTAILSSLFLIASQFRLPYAILVCGWFLPKLARLERRFPQLGGYPINLKHWWHSCPVFWQWEHLGRFTICLFVTEALKAAPSMACLGSTDWVNCCCFSSRTIVA